MRKWLLFLAALVALAGVLTACKRNNSQTTAAPPLQLTPPKPTPPPPVIVRIHFAGADEISSDTNSTAFTNEFASAEARALESQTLDKLSRAPGAWFKDKIAAGAGDGSAQLRPLLEDFLKSEWVFEMRGATNSPEYALAIRLNDARAQLWQTNLQNLLESWTKTTAQNVTNGWELKKDLPPNLFRFVRAGDWVVIGCGQNELPLSDKWVQAGMSLEKETNWLSVNVDWPRLGQFFPVLAKFDFPVTAIQATGINGHFLVTGKFELSQPLPPLDPWQIPTNIIYQPLTSFTAARGFGPWLRNQSWARLFKLSTEPDELFSWGLETTPLQTFIAVPVSNATNALAQVAQNFTADTSWQRHLLSPFQIGATPNRVFWRNVPFIGPEIKAMHGPSGDFLFADIFPNLVSGKAPPSDLFRAFTQGNVVFYHWEITPLRLKQLPQLTQLALLLTHYRQLNAQSAAGRWLNHITPGLDQNVTEVAQTGPSELTLTRTTSAGLTAVELTALANWLEAPNFPECDMSLPQQPTEQHTPELIAPQHPVKKLSAPAPEPVRAPATAPPAPH
jgi:hypothetical protein